ncbi:MAG: hypothetical protein ACRELF_00700 [Gemmataceae bacterium]
MLGLILPLAAHAQEAVKVSGRVVDAAGKPLPGVEVATFWYADKDKMKHYQKGTITDAKGRFALPITFYAPARGLFAIAKDRKTGALVVLEEKRAAKPLEIKLAPLVHVHGRFYCKELKKRPTRTIVLINSGQARFLQCISEEASFSFLLPAGDYKFWAYGVDIQDLKKALTLKTDKPDLDMGVIDMPATIIARHKVKAPPAWHVTDARGVKKDVKIADFKGKWVLLEFWGYW